jgi:citrate synthase
VAYLLINGELPTKEQYEQWVHEITYHTFVHENVRKRSSRLPLRRPPDGHADGLGRALSTFYPDARDIHDATAAHKQIIRMIAKMPTLGAWAFRHAQGKPFVYPDNDLGYTANFLSMLFKMSEPRSTSADERLVKALDVLFILHADHEQNCSTNAVRSVGSTQVDPYSAVAAGVGRSTARCTAAPTRRCCGCCAASAPSTTSPTSSRASRTANERLMGFGHRVYKNYDPRAKIIKKSADEVFEVTGTNPLLDIALELEKIALEDEYFVDRKLYPNVDFYSGLIYEAFQFPPEMFTVLFAIGRTLAGWLAQWQELVDFTPSSDKEQKIARPKQIYTGCPPRCPWSSGGASRRCSSPPRCRCSASRPPCAWDEHCSRGATTGPIRTKRPRAGAPCWRSWHLPSCCSRSRWPAGRSSRSHRSSPAPGPRRWHCFCWARHRRSRVG